MHTYYQTIPVVAALSMFDGHLYAMTHARMSHRTDGRQHVETGPEPRMLRVSHVKDGVAYAQLGKAGDAIACAEALPHGVVVTHEVDGPGHTPRH